METDLTRLRNLQAALDKAKSARVRVGCLGNKAARFDDDWNKEKVNNPTLGLWHEFGTRQKVTFSENPFTPGEVTELKSAGLWSRGMTRTRRHVAGPLPARSFLRMPLMTRLPGEVDKIGREVWRNLILRFSITDALKQLGVIGEAIVQQAFATNGFGQWKPVSSRYARWKERRFRSLKKGGGKFIGPIQQAILILSAQLRKSVTSAVTTGKTSS